MFKRLILLVLVCLLGVGGYSYFKFWHKPEAGSLWDLVPGNAVFVYESERFLEAYEEIKTQGSWQRISSIEAVRSLDSSFQYLERVFGKNNLEAMLANNQYLVSGSIVASNRFDFTHFMAFKDVTHHAIASSIINDLVQKKGFSLSTRTYLGSTISELSDHSNKVVFSYLLYENYFVGSCEPILVEDAIRALNDSQLGSFSTATNQLERRIVKLKSDHGNLYVQSKRVTEMLKVFLSAGIPLNNTQTTGISNTFLDVQFHEEHVSLTGFGFGGEGVLSLFTGDNGSANTMTDLLPENTAVFYHTSFSNAENHIENLNALVESNKEAHQLRADLMASYDFDVNTILQFINEEYGLICLPGQKDNAFNHLTLFKTENREEVLTYLKILVDRIANKNTSFVLEEDYLEYRIYSLEFPHFPCALFGDMYKGGGVTYYTSIDEYIVMGESLKDLRYLIDQIVEENTWGKSLVKNQFINLTNAEANFSIYFNTEEILEGYAPLLKPDWSVAYEDSKEGLLNMKMGAIQWSSIEDKFYNNVLLYMPSNRRNVIASKEKQVLSNVGFSTNLITKPYVVRNFKNGSFEVLLQDKSQQLLLADKNNNIKVLRSVEGELVTDIHTLDYYKNGKLQYLFATSTQVHLVDRNGNSVEGYPYQVSTEGSIIHLSLIDYNKTKDYRVAVVDDKGSIYLMDKTGKQLKGWNPRQVYSPLCAPLRHKRVINKDYMIAVAENGDIHVFKRNGNVVSGFPVTLGKTIKNEFFFRPGNGEKQSLITVLANSGELFSVNLKGAITARKQLYRPDSKSLFKMAIDASQKSFILGRTSSTGITIMDSKGEELFSKDYINASNTEIQYYYFGRGNQLILIHDLDNKLTYIFDKKGKALVDKPLASNGKVSVLHFSRSDLYKIYHAHGNELEVLELK